MYVLPVLLGDGIRFYSAPGLARIDLEPLDSTRHGAVTILRFRVRKQPSVPDQAVRAPRPGVRLFMNREEYRCSAVRNPP